MLTEEVLGEVDTVVDKGTAGEAKTVHSIPVHLLTITIKTKNYI